MSRAKRPTESRHDPRLRLPAMYTLVRVRRRGDTKFAWSGYIYDISSSGMRLELDNALEPGTEIEIKAMLPGSPLTTFTAAGHIVRRHDDAEDLGPIRMGMTFDSFVGRTDRRRLEEYLSQSVLKAA